MIRLVLVGVARLVFNAALLVLLLAVVLGFAAYRIARAGLARDPRSPSREASFAVLLALVQLARSLKDQTPAP